MPKARAGEQVSANAVAKLRPFLVEHIKFITLVREPFSRLLSQWRHDKYYTPRRFKGCAGLEDLVEHGASCIQAGEPAYRFGSSRSGMSDLEYFSLALSCRGKIPCTCITWVSWCAVMLRAGTRTSKV